MSTRFFEPITDPARQRYWLGRHPSGVGYCIRDDEGTIIELPNRDKSVGRAVELVLACRFTEAASVLESLASTVR